VLIPEVHFQLKGEKGLFKYLQGVLAAKGHCVVCVAEGAGQVRTAIVYKGGT
jgi:6-phosphofructokinase 1